MMLLARIAGFLPWQAWLIGGLLAAWLLSIKVAQWDRDAYWHSVRAAEKARTEGAMRAAGVTITETDMQILYELDTETNDYEGLLARLRAQRSSVPLPDACTVCRVPAGRL